MGALFGPTPLNARSILADGRYAYQRWRAVAGGYACPFIRCPRGCGGDLVWASADVANEVEVLSCADCGWRSRSGQLALTRDTINAHPPHVLFTTTEMLNRGLADAVMRATFTGSGGRRPRVLLLDEIHTYGGNHGAHVALLLRRWRHALGPHAPLHVVGLSATLEDPSEFMSKISGFAEVQEIGPKEDDLDARGGEYALILRGNPVSGTALLSTTIQTAFLLARLLEARSFHPRTGTSGSKLFAFTDDLDVTNRLYWDIRSAEGTYANRETTPLAALRRRAGQADPAARDAVGQLWDICPQLGHPLGDANRLRIARTSSQDAGVDPLADVIVATSSLEVGFDDPEVGAVVQHKAPRDDAAFVQRKGRAGRTTSMRPWTVVVLSDYGRDRIRYQAYESLFAPVVPSRVLPLENLHLLKMQAAFAFLDWLCLTIPDLRGRADLSEPATNASRRSRQSTAARVIEGVLSDPRKERDLARHVQRSLELDDDQLQAVMWESPRALMTSALPTMLRRLDARWTTTTGGPDRFVRDVPLPEHAPQALFGDLNLPEVTVVAAPRRPEDAPHETAMPVVQALAEFAPGRASRRFGIASYSLWHWIPVPNADAEESPQVDVAEHITLSESLGVINVAGEARPRPLLRPWRMTLDLADQKEQRSNARAVWTTEITALMPSWVLEVPSGSPGASLVSGLHFHTAAVGNEVEVARAVVGSTVTTVDSEVDVDLVRSAQGTTESVALGYRAPTDALRLRLRRAAVPSLDALPPAARRGALTAWFEEQVTTNPVLRGRASRFSLGWLSALYIASVAGVSIASKNRSVTLAQAVAAVSEAGTARCMERALTAVFITGEDQDDLDETRAIARLRALITDSEVSAELEEIAARLASVKDSDVEGWLARAVATTAASAFKEAFQRMCPDADVDGLIIDVSAVVHPDVGDGEIDVWLCEPDVGSGGTIEEIRRAA